LGDLLTVLIDELLKVSVAIDQSDSDHGDSKVRGGFAVVAGENAKATGIGLEDFMEAILGGEVGNQGLAGFRALTPPTIFGRLIFPKGAHHILVKSDDFLVFRRCIEFGLPDVSEKADSVPLAADPAFQIDHAEQGPGFGIPRPP
jgi:hypothetical protein